MSTAVSTLPRLRGIWALRGHTTYAEHVVAVGSDGNTYELVP